MKSDRALAYAAFAIVCTVWGTTYLAIRVAVSTIPPMLLTGIRYVVAGLILLTIARLRGDVFPRDRRSLTNVAIVGLLMVAGGNFSVIWAEQWVPSGIAALLVATSPFWAAIMERLRDGGEQICMRKLSGMIVGFLGVALLVTPGVTGGHVDGRIIAGAIAIQLGALAWQYGTLRGKHTLGAVAPLMSSALQMLAGGVTISIIGFAAGETSRFVLTPKTFGALAYLTFFGSVLAYTSYVYALKHMKTTTMSLYAYVNPIIAVLGGWLILGEQLTWVSITAMCVILAGVALVQTARTRRPRAMTIAGGVATPRKAA
jgi:drug/metabolite transporter (DMT)-like permease